ncbi:DUF4625 domain-containing protein [Pedobacter rhizosphaerae]|uniref:DUF4625 domain-containing protein n=1 Tax=Pedobacter rhizosphaerae TaxID=390241 RepID=A0A1H9TKX2_9SPHI|nr:DUF4625 domain-containing protein [Pedobacter rhizosphaerae]SER97831.1 protein of unknown function [Pedobacter rhizosphaerae]
MKKNYKKILLMIFLTVSALGACKKDNPTQKEAPLPTIDKVEVGLNNNEVGVIGRDFHFNANVLAGEKINVIKIKIQQISGETYAKPWNYEIVWEQYKGAKNTTVHKHFDIPSTAVEGKYDFIITVLDENGTSLEEKRKIQIYSSQNLPVDLSFDFGIDAVDVDFKPVRIQYSLQNIYDSAKYKSEDPINKNEFLAPIVSIASVKGDGKMYCLIINKKHNHRPETIAAIDFTKAIVADVWEHKSLTKSEFATNMFNFSTTPMTIVYPSIKIGTDKDKNIPLANPIANLKAWESGDYYVGFIYHNSTYNMGMYHYAEVKINME